MTLNGTVHKTSLLLIGLIATATITWRRTMLTEDPSTLYPYLTAGVIGGLVVGLITVFKKEWSPVTAPLYCVLEGLFLGILSAIFEQMFPGIVLQAV